MKKIVFLLSLIPFCVGTSVDASTTTTYDFEGYELQLTYMSDDSGNRGYEVYKVGQDPFTTTILNDGESITINDVTEINGQHVFYGYTHINGAASYYEGYRIVLNQYGEVVDEHRIDEGGLEEIVGVYEVDQIIMTLIACHHLEDRDEYIYDKTVIQTSDSNYQEIGSMDVFSVIQDVNVSDWLLLLNTDYDDNFEVGVATDLTIILEDDPILLDTNTIYYDSLYIPFINDAFLNYEHVSNGVYLDYPGNYTLDYNGFSYTFILSPLITGVEDGSVYNGEVTPCISSGNVYLNDDVYVSGSTITDPGTYELTVIGINHYTETIHFTITSNVDGVLHNQTYEDDVEIHYNGDGYLNNVHIESPYTIEDEGEYILTIRGENNYAETYFFTVDKPEEEQKTMVSFIQQYDIIFLGVSVIAGLLILKKK